MGFASGASLMLDPLPTVKGSADIICWNGDV